MGLGDALCRCKCHGGYSFLPPHPPLRADVVATLTACDLCLALHPPVLTVVTPRRRVRPTTGEGDE